MTVTQVEMTSCEWDSQSLGWVGVFTPGVASISTSDNCGETNMLRNVFCLQVIYQSSNWEKLNKQEKSYQVQCRVQRPFNSQCHLWDLKPHRGESLRLDVKIAYQLATKHLKNCKKDNPEQITCY